MSAFRPLTPDQLGGEESALRETILESRAKVVETIGLVAPDGSLRGSFDPLLRSPAIGRVVQELGLVVRSGSELGPAVCETVILVIVHHWGADFEWSAHRTVALAGDVLSEEDISRIAGGERPADRRLALAAEFAERQVRDHELDGETRAATLDEFGERGVVELTVLVGYYETVCRLIRVGAPDAVPS